MNIGTYTVPTIHPPTYKAYPKEFVEEVKAVTGHDGLARELAYNSGSKEHMFAFVLLEGEFKDAESFGKARGLYDLYQRLSLSWAHDHGHTYTSLAKLPTDHRTWSAGEHIFVTAILEGKFSAKDLWSIRHGYDAFKHTMSVSDPSFVPVGLTPYIARSW